MKFCVLVVDYVDIDAHMCNELCVSILLFCRLELISSLENVVLSTQYASLYSIFRFILQIFYDGGKLAPGFYFILEICETTTYLCFWHCFVCTSTQR